MEVRAATAGFRTAYRFLADGETEAASLTYGELAAAVAATAAWLSERAGVGEAALLVYPPGLEFVVAFLACLEAGVVAVPVHPPSPRQGVGALDRFAADADARLLLSTTGQARRLRRAAGAAAAPALEAARWLVTDRELPPAPAAWTPPFRRPGDLAFLQYTSGSTAAPKGVEVTHANLLANEAAIEGAFGMDSDSVVVSWLPPYHDMGLIGTVLQPLWCGGRAVLMSPLSFLRRPRRWLAAITRYRATVTGGPDFAYSLAARRVTAAQRDGLDLSSLRVAFCGAEPVRAATLERFARAFAPRGFDPRAFYPCYGLAEATLFVTGGAVEEAPVVRRVRPPGAGAARRRVGCGRPWPGEEVVIADPATGERLAPGRQGEIRVAGPAVARGYRGRPEETGRIFHARLTDGAGPFLRTGDLGFLDARGELFVTGRLKDLIIVRGRNLHPHDLEATTAAAHPALRPNGAAAFGVDTAGEEQVVVACEVERRREDEAAAAAAAVAAALADAHGAAPREVVPIRAGTLPRTTSGKVRRGACRDAYLAGRLHPLAATAEGAVRELGAEPEGDVLRIASAVTGRPVNDAGAPLHLDSLQAMELAHRLEDELGIVIPLSRLLAAPSPRELTAGETPPPLPVVDLTGGARHPLSDGQHALWLVERLDPDGASLTLAFAARVVTPRLTAAAVERALLDLARRHPALRTVFPAAGGEPCQVVGEPRVDFAAADATGWSGERLRTELDEAAAAPFDLGAGPLLRGRWVCGGPAADGVLLLAVHHLAADFWSLDLLVDELTGLLGGEELPSPPAASQPAFVHRRREELATGRGEGLLAAWRRDLNGAPTVLELPTDHPRPAVADRRGATHPFRLPPPLADGVRAAARAAGVTPFTWMLSAWGLVLGRWAGAPDLLLGSAVADRPRADLADVVGHFANLLPLRVEAGGDPPFGELARRTGRRLTDALDRQALPFPRLLEALAPPRDPSRHPLVQAGMVLETPRRLAGTGAAALVLGEAGRRVRLGGVELEPVPLAPRAVQLELLLLVVDDGRQLAASLQYAAALFEPATAARLAGWWRRALEASVETPARRLSELPLLAPEQRRQVVALCAAASPEPVPPLVHRAVAARAAERPEAPAVLHGSGGGGIAVVSYGELVRRVDRLARRLRAAGAGPEEPVGVVLERTPERVTALLACLAVGAPFVAVEPSDPPARRSDLLTASGCRLLLTAGLPAAHPPSAPWRRLDPADADPPAGVALPPAAADHPDAAAYVVFTSGSTGAPKGVVIPHRAVAHLAASAAADLGLGPGRRQLHFAALSFDISIAEVLMPLANGAAVALAGEDARRSGRALAADIRTYAATDLILTPTVLGLIPPGDEPPSLAALCVGGEPCPRAVAERWAGRVGLFNAYGPSETTVYSTLSPCAAGEAGPMRRLGRPIAGTRCHLVDRFGAPALPGAVGEIRLGGAGLARGYLGDPAATAAAFVPDPDPEHPGDRLYRTGDLARRHGDGGLVFAGRLDDQLKVAGVRLEPAEVEAALETHPAVAAAAVDRRRRRLVAWVVPAADGGPAPEADLRAHLAGRLPAPAVPVRVVPVAALPRTRNGKVDRSALEEPAVDGRAGPPPAGELERTVARLWGAELGLDPARLPTDVNFFELGGSSLALARVHDALCRTLEREVSLTALFSHATVGSLARWLANGDDHRAAGGPRTGDPLRPEGRAAARRGALEGRLERRRRARRGIAAPAAEEEGR